MNTRFLEAFVWIVRLGSFRDAAERLNLTQAAISSRISSLEEGFGKRLFERDARGVRLTGAGRLLLAHAERLLESTLQMQAAMQGGTELVGRLRIGVVETVVHTWLLDFLQAVQQAYPLLEIELTVESTRRLHDSLRRGALDLTLQTDAVLGEGIRNRELGLMPMGWVDVAGRGEPPRSLADIMTRPVITMTAGSQPHLALLDVCKQAGIMPTTVHCIASIDAIVRLVLGEVGTALIPRAAVWDHVRNGALRMVAPDVPLPPLTLVVSHALDPTSDASTAMAALAWTVAGRYADRVGPEIALVASR